jgi:hypothetical protein
MITAIERLAQGKGITHKYVCGVSVDYVEHGDPNRFTICLENGSEWVIRRPSDYDNARELELFSKYVDQRNQELMSEHP